MEKTELIQHWNYFCSLAERLDDTKHYIDHGLVEGEDGLTLVHGDVYSDYFKQIIVLASSEFEVMGRALCELKGHKVGNIVGISESILGDFPQIGIFEVSTPFWVNTPLLEWQVNDGQVKGLPWWKAYNSLKHGHKDGYKQATLENAIISLETLYIVDLYLMYLLFGDMSIASTYPTVYFKCKYLSHPVSAGEGLLPDFGNMSPLERAESKYPGVFKKNDVTEG